MLRRGKPRNRRTQSGAPTLERRTIVTDEATGREYTAIDRVMGAVVSDPFKVHGGLAGFMGPEIIPPTVQLVARRQLIRNQEKQ